MVTHAPALDRAIHALSNPTRRSVIERLQHGPATVTSLAEPFDMALPSFLQHLKVLEDGGLVRSRKQGRVRPVEALPNKLKPLGLARSTTSGLAKRVDQAGRTRWYSQRGPELIRARTDPPRPVKARARALSRELFRGFQRGADWREVLVGGWTSHTGVGKVVAMKSFLSHHHHHATPEGSGL